MKSLAALNNVEKAKLLHSLFPDEIPELLKFVQGMCTTIHEEEAQQREQWQNGIFSFDFWLSLIKEVELRIKKYGRKLDKSSLFSEQLFDGYNAMFTVHCLTVYMKDRQHPEPKFGLTIDLLFNA